MATITKDLGAVTAYAYAVSKGYTGTEEEFAEVLANAADDLAEVVELHDDVVEKAAAASASADSAAGSASTATMAAGTATTKAGEASESATAAGTSASQAAASALAANTSAGNASASASAAATSAGSASDSATSAAGSASDALDSAAAALASEQAAAASAEEAAASLANLLNGVAPLQIVESTEAADITSIDDGADGVPMKSLKVYIEPVQSGSGDPSPDNIRPISGWDGVEVTRCGENLLDTTGSVNGGINADGSVNANPADSRKVSKLLAIKPNTSYYLSNICPATQARTGYWYDANGNGVGLLTLPSTSARSGAVTSPGDAAFCRLSYFATDEGICMMTVGNTQPSAYSPYEGQTIPITFPTPPGTVYGGSLDVISGVLTVTDANIASYAGETLPGTWISDRDVYAQGTTPTTGAQVVYKLAEPLVYQLDPVTIESLLGTNNLFADTGNTSAIYCADPKMYIDNAIASAVAALS